jgi:ribose transport system permease protein
VTPSPDSKRVDPGQQAAITMMQRAIRGNWAALGSRIRTPDLLPYAILVVLVALISSQRNDYLSVGQLNLSSEVALSLVLVAAGQTFALLVGGFDLSVGGVMSLTTTVAATHFGSSGWSLTLWIVLILAGACAVGVVNGLIITKLGMQPFIVTLASWSVLAGVALLEMNTPGGRVPDSWVRFGNGSVLGLATATWAVIVLAGGWMLFRRSPVGRDMLAVGSASDAAHLMGASVTRTIVTAYALSAMFAAAAGLYLTTQISGGSPLIGNDYILPSVAAAVLGGARLTGGHASLVGTIVGAFILSIVGDVVFVFGLSGNLSIILTGVILLLVVVANQVGDTATKSSVQRLRSFALRIRGRSG